MPTEFPVLCSDRTASLSCMVVCCVPGLVVMHDDVIDGGATIVKLDSRARGADR